MAKNLLHSMIKIWQRVLTYWLVCVLGDTKGRIKYPVDQLNNVWYLLFSFFSLYLTVVSDLWGPQCVRLKVTVKSDNCGENAQCSGKGICFSNASMVSVFLHFFFKLPFRSDGVCIFFNNTESSLPAQNVAIHTFFVINTENAFGCTLFSLSLSLFVGLQHKEML